MPALWVVWFIATDKKSQHGLRYYHWGNPIINYIWPQKYEKLPTVCITLERILWQPSPHNKYLINTLRPGENGRHFADDIFKCIFLNENVWIPIKISLKFVLKGPINNIPALVQIMAWRRPGDKPLSEPMMVSLLIHICVTRPQWIKLIPGRWTKLIYISQQNRPN